MKFSNILFFSFFLICFSTLAQSTTYKAEREKAPEFGREIIDEWISFLENDSKIIIDYLKNNL